MATGDIFQLKDNQIHVGSPENIMNSYFFRQTSATGTAEDLAEAFVSDWMGSIKGIQANALEHRSIAVQNLFTVDDFHETVFDNGTVLGTYVGEMFPIHDAVTFRLVRTSRDIRNGYKRFAGIPETAAVGGVIGNPDYIAVLAVLADKLKGSVESEDTLMTWDHVVVKRIRVEPDEEHPNVRYRLPLTSGEADYSNPSDCLVNLFVRHQTSRGNS